MPLLDHSSIHEVNCTVRRRLDDMLRLIRISGLVPRHKFGIFILDEIQGATPEAINALLKPLEEPPPRTCWILCTSELGKVPKPIAGRCVQLTLTYPPPKALNPNNSRKVLKKA
jgi:DNA polymerase-3 subunit gamma/tau